MALGSMPGGETVVFDSWTIVEGFEWSSPRGT